MISNQNKLDIELRLKNNTYVFQEKKLLLKIDN